MHHPAPELKFTPLDLKRVDAAGTFAGYASLFDKEDMGHDIVLPGAFRDSLADARPHRHQDAVPAQPQRADRRLGQLTEDARGLYVRGRLMLDVARAREVLSLMRAGALDGLSIGFRAITGRRDAKTGIRRLEKVDLWEISVVTFPLLPEARIAHVKARRLRHRRPRTRIRSLAHAGRWAPRSQARAVIRQASRASPGRTLLRPPPARRLTDTIAEATRLLRTRLSGLIPPREAGTQELRPLQRPLRSPGIASR